MKNVTGTAITIFCLAIGLNYPQALSQTSPPEAVVAVSPADINIKVDGTLVSISGDTTTVVIGQPPTQQTEDDSDFCNGKKTKENGWQLPSWTTFSELAKTGAIFGMVGSFISVGFYMFYHNRNHLLVTKGISAFMELVNKIKSLW